MNLTNTEIVYVFEKLKIRAQDNGMNLYLKGSDKFVLEIGKETLTFSEISELEKYIFGYELGYIHGKIQGYNLGYENGLKEKNND